MTEAAIYDPKGLIRESFRIEGIGAPECRSIFLDWALGVPADRDTRAEIRLLLEHYVPIQPAGHPMLETLAAGLEASGPARRRGGRGARVPMD